MTHLSVALTCHRDVPVGVNGPSSTRYIVFPPAMQSGRPATSAIVTYTVPPVERLGLSLSR